MLNTESTSFTKDVLGRYVCNTFQEALDSTRADLRPDARPFDVIIIGGGTFGAALAEQLFQLDTETRRHRGARVARAENVERALAAAQKTAGSVGLLDAGERLAPTRQRLVAVRLMADVPDQAVAWGVEHPMESDGEFDRSEASREVAADPRAELDQLLAQLVRQRGKEVSRNPPEVTRISNSF